MWSIAERKLAATLEGHQRSVTSVTVTPDGRTIVSVADDKSVRLWSRPDGHPLAALDAASNSAELIALTPDGKTLITADQTHFGSAIRLWSLADYHLAGTLTAWGTVTSMLVTPDSRLLIAGSNNGAVLLYDLEKRELRGFLFDPAVNSVDGLSYNVYDKVTGQWITYTMPCGSPIPPGATCICNCVPSASSYTPAPSRGGGRGFGGGGTFCTCNQVCTCVPVYR